MLLDLSQIHEAHERLDRRYEPSAFGPPEPLYRLVAPVELAIDISRSGTQFRLVGRIRTRLEMACSRCLEPFQVGVDEDLDLTYLPHAANQGEGELEIDDDDLGIAFYRDGVIDLGQLMLEQFCLAVPMKALCASTCRGLCPVCGANLNAASCGCQRTSGDPRLAGLRGLLNEQGRD